MLRGQLVTWPLLRTGVTGLAEAQTRTVLARGAEVLVRHIPHRVRSTTAPVDPESIRRRPCFLCPESLYPEQKGHPFGDDYTIYANPFPIVERHLTIVHREHRPQRIDGQVGRMLDLAAALPERFVVYNGPSCGASAPDHLHLQAGSRAGLPIVPLALSASGPALEAFGARSLIFHGADRARVVEKTDQALAALSQVMGQQPEPWINLLVFQTARVGWTVVVFPRSKHRPDAFLTGELTVSPATIDLCGILVAPVEKDFERITGEDVAAIFAEVTLPDGTFRDVLARLEGS